MPLFEAVEPSNQRDEKMLQLCAPGPARLSTRYVRVHRHTRVHTRVPTRAHAQPVTPADAYTDAQRSQGRERQSWPNAVLPLQLMKLKSASGTYTYTCIRPGAGPRPRCSARLLALAREVRGAQQPLELGHLLLLLPS